MGCLPKYLGDLKGGRDLTGSPSLGTDGVFRTVDCTTKPPTVIDALGLTPEQLDEFFKCIGLNTPDMYQRVDGSQVPREQWFKLPEDFEKGYLA